MSTAANTANTANTANNVLAVIGGSGLYNMERLENRELVAVSTPFGDPSDRVLRGTLDGTNVLFLPRHGKGHRINPSGINYRANICALKKLGATHLVLVSAVGSMKETIHPGDVVLADQFIDLTKHRVSTFFDEGPVVHVSMADPVCPLMLDAASKACEAAGATFHCGGTYVCVEGPQFSTRAESLVYRSWGASVIGMTNMPEVKLAREAELPTCVLALVTDYDCWHQSQAPVTAASVIVMLSKAVGTATRILDHLAPTLPNRNLSPASHALQDAFASKLVLADPIRQRLAWLVEPYLDAGVKP